MARSANQAPPAAQPEFVIEWRWVFRAVLIPIFLSHAISATKVPIVGPPRCPYKIARCWRAGGPLKRRQDTGICQRCAKALADEGSSFRQIPSRYFPDTGLRLLEREHVAGPTFYGTGRTDALRQQEGSAKSVKKAYRGWEECQVVLTYGPLKRADEPPQLVPLTIFTEARYKKDVYWCRSLFTNFRIFSSRVKIVAGDHVQSLPQ